MNKKESNPFPPEGIKTDLLPPAPPPKRYYNTNNNIDKHMKQIKKTLKKLNRIYNI